MQYQVIMEWLEHPDIGAYRTYSLRVVQTGELIHDVSTDRAFVLAMARLFERCGLAAVHAPEVVADFVSCPEAFWEAVGRDLDIA